MSEWIKVVTEPLGLAGFVLFLVFGYLAKLKKDDERRWLAPFAFGTAAVALVGGLMLAYLQVAKPTKPAVPTSKPAEQTQSRANQQIQQTSTGEGSPNVQGVQGDVIVTVDQSKAKTETQKPAEKNPKSASK